MANSTLSNAKAAKKDEFYTMFYDIETEMEAYLDYNPNVFVTRRFFCLVMTRNGVTSPSILHRILKNWV